MDYLKGQNIRGRYQQLLFKMAKEVDDGVFYERHGDKVAWLKKQAGTKGYEYRGGNAYIPWGLTIPDMKTKSGETIPVDSPMASETRNLYAKAEKFRMNEMPPPKMDFSSKDLIPSELEFEDTTEREMRKMQGEGLSKAEKNEPYSTGYMPMSYISQTPTYLGPNINEMVLQGLKDNDAILLPAAGGFGKTTMWKYFGFMAAQHSLSHLSLWLKEPKIENVFNPEMYLEKRIILFNAKNFSVDEGTAGGSDAIWRPLRELFITNKDKYKDIFILVADEIASALAKDATRALRGGGKVGPRVEFDKNMKDILDPGGIADSAATKFVGMYDPVDYHKFSDSDLAAGGQFGRRTDTLPLPVMEESYIKTLISRAIFSLGRLPGILEGETGIKCSRTDPNFNNAYMQTGNVVMEDVINAIVKMYPNVKVAIDPSPDNPGVKPDVGPPDRVKKIIKAGGALANKRLGDFPGIEGKIKEYNELREMKAPLKKELRKNLEELEKMKSNISTSGAKKTFVKKAQDDDSLETSTDEAQEEGFDEVTLSPRDNVPEMNIEQNVPGSEEYGEERWQADIKAKEDHIEGIRNNLRSFSPRLSSLEAEMEVVRAQLEHDYNKTIDGVDYKTDFLPNLADLGWLKPIDIAMIDKNKLVITNDPTKKKALTKTVSDPGEPVDYERMKIT